MRIDDPELMNECVMMNNFLVVVKKSATDWENG